MPVSERMSEQGVNVLVTKELLDLTIGEGKLAVYCMRMANGVSMGPHGGQPTQSRCQPPRRR